MSTPQPVPSESTIVKVTPELAADWLENRNLETNRKLSSTVAARYAKAMAEARWLTTHQGIAFDNDGFLIDGQHRLKAVIIAGIPVELFVAVGFSNETFAVLDSGHRRQAGQMITGKYGPMLAAAARFLGVADGTFTDELVGNTFAMRADSDQILAIVEAWPELHPLCPMVSTARTAARITPAPHLAVMAQAARTRYADRIDAWGRGLINGAGLSSTDPRLVIRNRFIRDTKMFQASSGRAAAYAYIVKAWNAFAVGADLRFLRYRDEEAVPVVIS